jgi:hypothetical protein
MYNLTSPELADKQVQFIVETQLLLKPYLEGREKMHLLYVISTLKLFPFLRMLSYLLVWCFPLELRVC